MPGATIWFHSGPSELYNIIKSIGKMWHWEGDKGQPLIVLSHVWDFMAEGNVVWNIWNWYIISFLFWWSIEYYWYLIIMWLLLSKTMAVKQLSESSYTNNVLITPITTNFTVETCNNFSSQFKTGTDLCPFPSQLKRTWQLSMLG